MSMGIKKPHFSFKNGVQNLLTIPSLPAKGIGTLIYGGMIAEWEGLSRVSRIVCQNPKFGGKLGEGKRKAPGIVPGALPTLSVVGDEELS